LKLTPSQPYLPKGCAAGAIDGLTAKNFHVFADGVEQQIQSVSARAWTWDWVRDTLGFHHAWSYTPLGKWSARDLVVWARPTGFLPRYYLIAFAPPTSPEGSCHQLKVLVDSTDAEVFARDQYCNVQDYASDPLYGTPLGKLMETGVPSSRHHTIPLSLQAASFYTGTNTARVDIALELPMDFYITYASASSPGIQFTSAHLKYEWKDLNAIGVLGMVYKKDGVLAKRFSDLGCCARAYPELWLAYSGQGPHEEDQRFEWDPINLPTRYEAQIDLPSGEYNLVTVLSDGPNFGRVAEPLNIDAYDGAQLALSSVVLCKRGRDAAVAAQEAAAAHLAPKYVPLVSQGVQMTPAADLRFRADEPLVAYFEIYEPLLLSQPATTVWAHLKLVNAKTGAVKEDFAPMNVTPYIQRGSSVIPISHGLKVHSGAYRLEVQATDSAGRTTPWRTANFTVE